MTRGCDTRLLAALLVLGLQGLAGTDAGAQATYTWALPGSGAWNVAANWSPARTAPAADDILVVDGKGVTFSSIPTQVIGQLKLANNAVVSLFGLAPGPVTLTISGGAGTDLDVPAGCQLVVQSNSTSIGVQLGAGASAAIGGIVLLGGTNSRLAGTDAMSIVVGTGGQITNAGATVPFGTTAFNSVEFQSGSTFLSTSGGDAFGAAAPNAVSHFATGSVYRLQQSQLPSMSGRTFADLDIVSSVSAAPATGSAACTIDDLTVHAGTPHLQLTNLHLRGDVTLLGGAHLDFNPTAAQVIHVDGPVPQTWAGGATFNANAHLSIENASGVTCTAGPLAPSQCTVAAGATLVLGSGATFTNVGTTTVNGTLMLGPGGNLPGGNAFTYGGAGTLVFANSTLKGFASLACWPPSNGPAHVSMQGAGGVLFQSGLSLTVPGTLTLGQGVLDTGSGSLTIGPSGSVVGGGPASHVKGTLVKHVAAGGGATTRTFEVGDGSVYAPLDFEFSSVVASGTLAVSTTAGDHPSLAGSGLDPLASVNRSWSVTGAGVVPAAFGVTFHFAASDLDPAAHPAALTAQRFTAPSTWTALSADAPTSTSLHATGVAGFGDFAIGELLLPCGGGVAFGRSDYPAGGAPHALGLGDLDGDGVADLASANYSSHTISILRGNAAGGFGPPTTRATGFNPVSMAIGDVDGDGRRDLAVANWSGYSVGIYLGDGQGGVGPPNPLSVAGARPISSRLADLDGDGDLDVVSARWDGADLWVQKGDGAGGFAAAISYSTGPGPYDLALGDLDADGDLDAVVALRGYGSIGNSIAVLLGDGAGGFAAPVAYTVGGQPSCVALGDFNRDLRLDVVTTNELDHTITIRHGDGAGGFGVPVTLATQTDPFSVTTGDFNADGRTDLAVVNIVSASISVFLSDCAGGFLAPTHVPVGGQPRGIVAHDVDGDGRDDLLFADAGANRVTVLRSFPAGSAIPSPAASTLPLRVTAGPDGNCCFDVVVRDLANNPIAGSTVSVGFDSCAVTFCAVQPPGLTRVGNRVFAVTGPDGAVHICACIASQLSSCRASILADGVLLGGGLLASSCASDSACVPDTWRTLSTTGPGARFASALGSNFDDETVLLFGGEDGSGYLGDTWRWDGFTWHALSPTTSPAARSGHSLAYDRHRRRIVMFGGRAASGALGDTWEFDGSNWTQVATTGPAPRWGHGLAFDEYRGRIVLFGGTNGGEFGDTWEWDGASWVETTPTTSPAARRDAAMAFDYTSGVTMLFGGSNSSGALADTWIYAQGFWLQLGVAGPSARALGQMVYSPEGDALVLFGGTGSDPAVWRFTGGKWQSWAGPGGARVEHALAYDFFNDHVMLFGGRTSLGQTTGLGDTREWCSPCPLVVALEDSLGEVLVPANADPDEWTETDPVAGAEQDTRIQHPEATLGNDTWPGDAPCALSFGGEADSLELEDPWLEEADSLGIELTEAELADSIEVWEQRLIDDPTLNAEPFPDSLLTLPGYVGDPSRHCLDRTKKYAFGGRDIVFVHGLRTTPLKERMWSLNDDWVDWVPPNGQFGYVQNPEYYDRYGYWKNGAINYWQRHIDRFLRDRGYSNRYLIVAWPATQRMKYGISAFLSQVSDAMLTGRGVVDLSGHGDTLHFGQSPYVVVSHSTGGALVSAALAVAKTNPGLNAGYVADHCKAHLAIQGAFSGSRIASVACGLSGVMTVASPYWMCRLIQSIWGDNGHVCSDIVHFDSYLRGVTFDLMPRVMQSKWGGLFGANPAPTATIVGGHPTFQAGAKHLLLTGLDDGVLTVNSASANPAPIEAWPSGYFRIGPQMLSGRAVKDLGINTESADHKKLRHRSRGYYWDQLLFRNWAKSHGVWDYRDALTWVAGGCTDEYSPTGMVQPPHLDPWPFFGDPLARYANHFSFIECASDHFGMTPSYLDEDFVAPDEYKLTDNRKGDEHNEEEVRVVFAPEMKTPYTVGPDSAPLVDEANPIVSSGLSTVQSEESKCAKRRKNGTCKRYRWQRTYVRLKDWQTMMAPDYAYDFLLTQMSSDTCWLRRPTDAAAAPFTFYARNVQNPFSRDLTIEFQLPERARVELDVYDAQGRRLRSLVRESFGAGPHHVVWDRRTDAGGLAGPGLYFWRLRLNGAGRTTEKAVLVR